MRWGVELKGAGRVEKWEPGIPEGSSNGGVVGSVEFQEEIAAI